MKIPQHFFIKISPYLVNREVELRELFSGRKPKQGDPVHGYGTCQEDYGSFQPLSIDHGLAGPESVGGSVRPSL